MRVPRLAVPGNWDEVLIKQPKTGLEALLPAYLRAQRWFGGKARPLRAARIEDAVPLPYASRVAYMAFVRVSYEEGNSDVYALPLAFCTGKDASGIEAASPQAVLARLASRGQEGLLVTPMRDPGFCHALLDAIGGGKRFCSAWGGEILGTTTGAFGRLVGQDSSRLEPSLMRAEQSNSSILYGDRVILKLFRRLDEGVNPDLEVGAFLTEAGFAHIPAVGGALEYRRADTEEAVTLGILQGFVPSEGDAWSFTLDALAGYYERVVAQAGASRPEPFSAKGIWELLGKEPTPGTRELMGTYLEAVELLGTRTAELHLALASDGENPAFAPEPFTPAYQRSLHELMRSLAERTFQLLGRRLPALPEPLRAEASRVYALRPQVLDRFRSILDRKLTVMRTRVHGDFHLGQVLYTGRDFVIIDFEGEPARSISERRIKRSPLRDIAGMLRSFHYAAYSALMDQAALAATGDIATLDPWANRWYVTVASVFATTYLEVAAGAPFLPKDRGELISLLDAYQLEKAIYEMAYELNNRPNWLMIPLQGILHMLEESY